MLGPRSSSRTKSRWTRGFWSWHPHNPSNDAKIAPDFFQRPLQPQEKAGERAWTTKKTRDEWLAKLDHWRKTGDNCDFFSDSLIVVKSSRVTAKQVNMGQSLMKWTTQKSRQNIPYFTQSVPLIYSPYLKAEWKQNLSLDLHQLFTRMIQKQIWFFVA